MTLIDKETYTEYEVIMMTMDYGFEGNEFKTARWIKNGSLDGAMDKVTGEFKDRAIKALISKLKTFYDFVEVVGKGKNRRYILWGKKEKQTEREMNYQTFATSPDGNTMIEYVFNQLLEIKENDISITYWTNLINLPQINESEINAAIEEMTELYSKNLGDNTDKIVNKVVNEINSTINSRNIEVVKTAFNHLKKQNRIQTIDIYCLKKLDGHVQIVNQNEFEKVQKEVKKIVEEQEVNWNKYVNARRNKNYYTKELRVCKKLVKEYLSGEGIDYEFKRLTVEIINDEMIERISQQEISIAWCNDFIRLTENKQKSEKYSRSQYLSKELYLLNVCIMLKSYLNKNQLSIIETETTDINKRFNSMHDRYIEIKLLESEENERPIGFGQTIEHNA